VFISPYGPSTTALSRRSCRTKGSSLHGEWFEEAWRRSLAAPKAHERVAAWSAQGGSGIGRTRFQTGVRRRQAHLEAHGRGAGLQGQQRCGRSRQPGGQQLSPRLGEPPMAAVGRSLPSYSCLPEEQRDLRTVRSWLDHRHLHPERSHFHEQPFEPERERCGAASDRETQSQHEGVGLGARGPPANLWPRHRHVRCTVRQVRPCACRVHPRLRPRARDQHDRRPSAV
jgi:hypothetical protein